LLSRDPTVHTYIYSNLDKVGKSEVIETLTLLEKKGKQKEAAFREQVFPYRVATKNHHSKIYAQNFITKQYFMTPF